MTVRLLEPADYDDIRELLGFARGSSALSDETIESRLYLGRVQSDLFAAIALVDGLTLDDADGDYDEAVAERIREGATLLTAAAIADQAHRVRGGRYKSKKVGPIAVTMADEPDWPKMATEYDARGASALELASPELALRYGGERLTGAQIITHTDPEGSERYGDTYVRIYETLEPRILGGR